MLRIRLALALYRLHLKRVVDLVLLAETADTAALLVARQAVPVRLPDPLRGAIPNWTAPTSRG
jgi:hypothetical protein